MSTSLPPLDASETGSWVGVVANAFSGTGQGKKRVEQLTKALAKRGLSSRVAWTHMERSSLVDASRQDKSCRCLVAVGGDGTVAALLNERPGVPITVLPTGTENLFARHFALRNDPERVAETIVSGTLHSLDLGQTENRSFALMAGIGFDADVVSRYHATRTSHGGQPQPSHRVAYVEPVLRASWAYQFPLLSIDSYGPEGNETFEGTTAFLFNLPRYALGLPFVPHALGDDGLLDLLIFRKPGPFRALHYLWLVFLGVHLKQSCVIHRRVQSVSVSSAQSVPIQLDGDPAGSVGGDDPMSQLWSAKVVPNAVAVLSPK